MPLVCAIGREIGNSRVYLLGLYREREFDLSHTFSVMLGKLSKLARNRCHLLSGFSITETAEYAAALDRDFSGSPENGRSLHTLTHGNPLFIRHLAPIACETLSTGIHSREDFRLPPGLREAIGITLEELSDSCVEVLKTASLL